MTRLSLNKIGIVLIVLFICLGPSSRQIFGVKHPLFREWVMFSAVGLGSCRGSFSTGPQGSGELVNRLEMLGYPSLFSAPRSVRLWRTEQEAVGQGRELCRREQERTGRLPELYLRLECAQQEGWVTASRGNNDLCRRFQQPAFEVQ